MVHNNHSCCQNHNNYYKNSNNHVVFGHGYDAMVSVVDAHSYKKKDGSHIHHLNYTSHMNLDFIIIKNSFAILILK